MRRLLLPLMTLVVLCAVQRPAIADDETLTADEAAWLQSVVGAGWTGSSEAGSVSITARNVAAWSEHLEPVLGKVSTLDEKQRAALLDLVRVTVTEPGWLGHFAVEPGRYSFGLRMGLHDMQIVASDAKGKIVHVDAAYLNDPSDDKPHTQADAGGGSVTVSVYWGSIESEWKFVSRKTHDDALGALTERRAGRVSIYSDLPDEARIPEIAELANKAVAANETLTGAKTPEGFRYTLYLLGQHDTYEEVDNLLTSGTFSSNGAFTAWLTSFSYVYYYTHWDGDFGLPSSLLEVIIHELHHQFVYNVFPCMRYSPDWWQESMAELAAQKGLELVDQQAATNYRKRRLSDLVHATRAGRLTTVEDMLSRRDTDTIGSYYTSAWTLGQALDSKPKDIVEMWTLAAEYNRGRSTSILLRRELDQRYLSAVKMIDNIRAKAARDGEWYIQWNATMDERDGVLEINTEVGLGGIAVLNQPAQGNSVTLSGEFRWNPDDASPQADFVFAYAAGSTEQRFLKVALLPDKAILFRHHDGEWYTFATTEYETKLESGKADKPLWHPFELTYDALTGKVRLETTGGRWAEFEVTRYIPCKDTLAGVGTYDAVVWYKNVKVK